MTRYFHHLQRWWLVCFSFFSVLACLACFDCRFFRRVLLFDGLLFVLQFHRKTPDFGSGITTGFHLQIMAFDAMLRNVLDLNVVQWPHVSIQPKFRRIRPRPSSCYLTITKYESHPKCCSVCRSRIRNHWPMVRGGL